MTRGGKRKGPGHPVTTGMAKTPPIHYRVTPEQHAELVAEARKLPKVRRKYQSASAAAKLRAFPAVTAAERGGRP